METFQPEGGERRTGRGEEGRRKSWACRDMNCHMNDCSRTKADDVSSAGRSWSRAGFFGIFWPVCTTCRIPPEPVAAEAHDGGPH